MIKYIHTFGSSFTEGGGFEWWKFEEVKQIYHPYILQWPDTETQFPFSWPGQLEKLMKQNPLNVEGYMDYLTLPSIKNYGKCGWGNERTYRKIFGIVNESDFNPKEHLFLVEFSDECRAEFFSVKEQRHMLVNYDLGDEKREGLIWKENVYPVFDYHRGEATKSNQKKQDEYFKSIAPMLTEFIKTTFDSDSVIKKILQNQITFCSYMELNNLNWLVPLPNAICWHPQYHKLFKDRIIFDEKHQMGYQYAINDLGLGFGQETSGVHTDFHGGIVWAEQVAKRTYNLMCDWGWIGNKVDASHKSMMRRRKEVRTEILSRRKEMLEELTIVEGQRRRGGLSEEDFHKDLI